MDDDSSKRVIDDLLADLAQERQIVDLIIRGCIELRWAIAPDEADIARAMIYNAFESYAIARGMSVEAAERFCERHLDELISRVMTIL